MHYSLTDGVHVGEWVAARLGMYYVGKGSQAIGLLRDGVIVAGVVYEDWNGKSIVCHIAAERVTREFLHAACDFAYNRCGVHKVIAPVYSDNEKAIRFVTKMGFTLESTIREAQPGGHILLFTMTAPQCRYLGENRGKESPSPAIA